MKKILLFSSLKKPKEVINATITSWLELKTDEKFSFDILVHDDNYDSNSSHLITSFAENSKLSIANFEVTKKDSYEGDHRWNLEQIDRISEIKNKGIEYALANNYDFLFLVDADLVLHPKTLLSLLFAQKDFIFEIFWTQFYGESYYKPNAWDFHSWGYYNEETILQLSEPGIYRIGGGGACSLLSKEILEKGLNFNRIQSLKYNGEDRHFCSRAQALGYEIFVDTHYPAYHIFHVSQVEEAEYWFQNGADQNFFKQWLTEAWKQKVIQSFRIDRSFFGSLKRFQYKFRKDLGKLIRGKY